VEFNEACKEYAIVFTRSANGKVVPVVMLGLRARENLFVDAQERWTPPLRAGLRAPLPLRAGGAAGPVSWASASTRPIAGLNDTEGEALFDAKGRTRRSCATRWTSSASTSASTCAPRPSASGWSRPAC
jgi:hypothetical protein